MRLSPEIQTLLIGTGAALLTVTVLEILSANGLDYYGFISRTFGPTPSVSTEGV
jgi:hypothetical protein